MADSDVSLDREGQRAVDGAQEADVSGGQEVGQHVDPEHLKAGLGFKARRIFFAHIR